MLANLAASIREVFAPSAWMIVEHDEVAGLCSLHRAPAGGELWIGYGVAPNRQGRGIATRAVEELILWARADPRVQSILAETHVANPASRAVLKRNGFLQTGRRSDEEDGELLSWALRTPP
jgi:RimJ/RimL family protein N-acetyltransferase